MHMGMLERIKKKQIDGFREFVLNLETTTLQLRRQMLTSGILEDPTYMIWVMKNIRTIDDFLKLPLEEIESVLLSQEGIINVFVRALDEKILSTLTLETDLPKLSSKIRDEKEFAKDIPPEVKASARSHILKAVRKLQSSETIQGFSWQLPPVEIFHPKTYVDGETQINFDSGLIAAQGMMRKNKRQGPWVHYYDNGRTLAQGDYLDDLKVGEWKFYYTNGKDRAQGTYLQDQRHGLWDEWDREGEITKVEYNKDVRT